MGTNKKYAGNPLGDLRAENDHEMLDVAFYKTPDYRTLIESNDKSIVVGRRGVGKSALVYQLEKHWSQEPGTRRLTLRLEKSQVFTLIPHIEKFERYNIQSAACEKCWKYTLMLELLNSLPGFKALNENNLLQSHLKTWRSSANETTARLRKLFEKIPAHCSTCEAKLSWLLDNLGVNEVEKAFDEIMQKTNKRFFILVDRLDEGYEPTSAGIGLVDGILNAVIELNAHHSNIRAILFIRDNIFRTIAKKNPDFSANIEGQAIRLHWNDYHLMNMVTERLRKAFDAKEPHSQKVWDRFAARELKGRDGFRHCLQLTLYRPRDIMLLLNGAFYNAFREDRSEIIPSDVTEAGKNISVSRLEDLHKEYSSVIPGIDYLTRAFANQKPEFILEDANRILSPILRSPKYATPVIQEFAILAEPIAALRSLYGIGFVGIKSSQGCYIFCHDGNSPDKEIVGDEKFSIHPCYWMSLNISGDPLSSSDAGEIYDEKDENEEDGKHSVKNEYKIKVTEPNIEQRNKKLNAHIAELDTIPLGHDGTTQFAIWCQRAIQIVFPESLREIEKKTPIRSKQSAFFEANNYASTCSWEILNDKFGCEKALFGVYNQKPVPKDVLEELAEMSRANKASAAFLITREDGTDDFGPNLLPLLREVIQQKHVMILNISSKALVSLLSKLRSLQKHDVAETALNSLLKQYRQNFLKNADQICGKAPTQSVTIRVDYPTKNCFGELGVDPASGKHQISICCHHGNGGNKSVVAGPIELQPQAYQILETGFSDAKKNYIEELSENARSEGKSIIQYEIDLPPEKTLLLQWTQDDLAKIICHQDCWADLKRNQKDQIKTAMSRLRKLFCFPNDPCGLITESDNNCRSTTIPFRLAKS